MKIQSIDINCDLGEEIGNEAELMPFLSSCNIACGGHAGNEEIIRSVIKLAKEHRVKVGAHPSFPDRENFGRQEMKISEVDLKNSLIQQIELVKKECLENGILMNHIKPHGALYNLCNVNEFYAQMVVAIIEDFYPETKLYAPYKSKISAVAKGRIPIYFEGFADRNYEPDYTLVSRQKNNAIIKEKEAVFKHVFDMISKQKIKAVDGTILLTKVDTICLHGDNPKAVEILQYTYQKLYNKNIKIEKTEK